MYQLEILNASRRAFVPVTTGTRDELDSIAANVDAPGYRIRKADKAHKVKLPHSISVPAATSWHGISVTEQAKIMAARLKASGPCEFALFPDTTPDARAFNRALLEALGRKHPIPGGYRVGLPECYTIRYVDPADYTPQTIRAEIEREMYPESIAA